MSAIYEKYLGRSRDSFSSFRDVTENYHITYEDDFNFAYDIVDELGTTKPDKLAMLWVGADGTEKRFTFRDMMNESNKAANLFRSYGLKKGDRVMLVLRRSYYFWFCMLGLAKIGAIACQATDMLKKSDYVYRCNVGKINAVVITDHGSCTEYFDEGDGEYETVKYKFVLGHKRAGRGWIDFEEEFEKQSAEFERPDEDDDQHTVATDVMLLAFSSGTSGYPKMITHDFRYPLGHIITGVFWHRVVDGGLHFTISDTGWLKSLWGKFYGQWFGESAVFVYDFERFEGGDILSKLEKYRITTFCAPPTMYRMMLLCHVGDYDLSSITHCCTAGEALSPEIFNRWYDATGLKIYEGFGQTETTCSISTLYPWTEPTPGAMGLPSPGYDVRILDEDGNDVTRGSVGEICIRAKPTLRPCGLMVSYNWNKKDTKYAYRGGWYHTGDTAYRDEDGRFCYVGRNDDIIKSSGYRIGPFEVESTLLEHPAVLECAVTGVPDDVRGFKVKATIVLSKGYEPSEALIKELQTFVKLNTAPYKYPRVIEFVDSLPKTISGKIRRAEIRQRDIEKYREQRSE